MSTYQFFKKLQGSLNQLEKDVANIVVAVELENFVEHNFQTEGFTDTSLIKWQPRKKPDPKNGKRALLVDTTALHDAATKARTKGDTVTVAIPLDYAQVHNEGGQAGRGKGFTMPKRQYIGESAYLNKKIEAKARKLLDDKFSKL